MGCCVDRPVPLFCSASSFYLVPLKNNLLHLCQFSVQCIFAVNIEYVHTPNLEVNDRAPSDLHPFAGVVDVYVVNFSNSGGGEEQSCMRVLRSLRSYNSAEILKFINIYINEKSILVR
jgi:hypothetical protein